MRGLEFLDGVLLLDKRVLGDLLDRVMYLEGNMKLADERRIKREKARWGKNYFPHTHPDSFYRPFKIAHKRYRLLYKPKITADMVVRGK